MTSSLVALAIGTVIGGGFVYAGARFRIQNLRRELREAEASRPALVSYRRCGLHGSREAASGKHDLHGGSRGYPSGIRSRREARALGSSR
jgi:hypothetical protein